MSMSSQGRAVAIKVLCNIFSLCKAAPFNTVYLSRFYACLSQVFPRVSILFHSKINAGKRQVLHESTEVMIAGLTNAGILFPCELPGFRILTPAFVYGLNKVLLRVCSYYNERGCVLTSKLCSSDRTLNTLAHRKMSDANVCES